MKDMKVFIGLSQQDDQVKSTANQLMQIHLQIAGKMSRKCYRHRYTTDKQHMQKQLSSLAYNIQKPLKIVE